MGGSITQCTEAALFSALLLLFSRNEYVFIPRGECRWHRRAFMWTDCTKRKKWRQDIKYKEFKFSQEWERRPHNCVKFRYFTLSWRGLRCAFTPFWPFPTELFPGFQKLANKGEPGNLEVGTERRAGTIHGVLLHLKHFLWSITTDQSQLIGPLTSGIFTLRVLVYSADTSLNTGVLALMTFSFRARRANRNGWSSGVFLGLWDLEPRVIYIQRLKNFLWSFSDLSGWRRVSSVRKSRCYFWLHPSINVLNSRKASEAKRSSDSLVVFGSLISLP